MAFHINQMGLEFEVRSSDVEEIYPDELEGSDISDFLAKLKADSLKGGLSDNEILVTSDTVVWHKGKSLAKAANAEEAFEMIRTMSNDSHEVITSVCFTTTNSQKTLHEITKVKFRELSDEEIRYYIESCKPYDKAGAYGIQEWIGLVGIVEVQGSYNNVVGLPTQMVYVTLKEMMGVEN